MKYYQHKWGYTDHVRTCDQCGLQYFERPIPGRLKWWRDWVRGDQSWSTERGDLTPPCETL